MLKLIFLLIVPGALAGFLSEDIRPGKKMNPAKFIVQGLFFSYILFMVNITVFCAFFALQYSDFLAFLSRTIETVQDVFLFFLLMMVQVILAFAVGMTARMIQVKSIERAILRMTNLQKNMAGLSFMLTLLIVIINFVIKDSAERQLVINEVCSRNHKVLMDENGNYKNYIEIYNPSKWNILLKDFVLSENMDLEGGIRLEEAIVPAKGYYIAWIDTAETIYFATSSGEIVDSVTIPVLEANTVYARSSDGASDWTVEVPSPMEENDVYKKYLDKPVFSAESGFYDSEFMLSISAQEGEEIYYTLDGSIPDENDTLYTEEIVVKNISDTPNRYYDIPNTVREWDVNSGSGKPVDKAFVVRAIVRDEHGNKSDVVTKTYFVDMEEYKDKYVLSLVSDPEDLFGDDGIYVTGRAYDDWYLGEQLDYEPPVNFELRGREAEIDTSVTLFYNTPLMEQEAGLRIQGASQRANPLKRFSVFARKEYSGSRYFEHELFGEKMHSFFTRADFDDAFIHSLVEDRSVGTLKAVEAAVFLDGEHWYDTYLREKYSEDYIAHAYGVNRQQVRLEEAIPEEIYSFLGQHDLSVDENYKQFCEMVDIQSYIDYLATNIYMCNMDASEYKNCRLWKTTVDLEKGYNDGRWRWLIYDMDSISWNSIVDYGAMRHGINSFAQEKAYAGVAYNQETMYKALRSNEEFCKQFVLTFMDLANENFSAERISEEITLWGYDMSWNDCFFEKRFKNIVPAMAEEFDLQGELVEVQLSVNTEEAGYVTINTLTPELRAGSWKGSYYTDYPVTLTAIANEGYEFVGWKNKDSFMETAQISVEIAQDGCNWEAVFQEKAR